MVVGRRVVVGVNLSRYADFSEAPGNLLAMIQRMVGIIARQNGRVSARAADCVIEPMLRGFGSYDLGRAEDLVAAGQDATRGVLPVLEELLRPPEEPALRRWLQRAFAGRN